jgi:hypothetical protein
MPESPWISVSVIFSWALHRLGAEIEQSANESPSQTPIVLPTLFGVTCSGAALPLVLGADAIDADSLPPVEHPLAAIVANTIEIATNARPYECAIKVRPSDLNSVIMMRFPPPLGFNSYAWSEKCPAR